MAGKLVKKGQAVSKPVPEPVSKPASKQVSLRGAVAAKVASRPTEQTDARLAWRKLFGG